MLPNIIIICQITTNLYSFNYFLYFFDQLFIQIYQYGIEKHTFSAIMVLYQKINADNRKLFYFDAPRVAISVTNTASGSKKCQKRKIKTIN